MKKTFYFLAALFLSVSSLHAQVSEDQVEFNKVKRTVKVMEVQFAPEFVEEAVKTRMSKAGYKSSESKGWLIFKGVTDSNISTEASDLYVKVDRKSRKDKDVSVVHFFTSKPNDNTSAAAMSENMLASSGFYSKISDYSRENKLEKDILEQEDNTKKSQKKYDDLVKEQSSLEKKIKDLQSDLESNKKKQEAQKTEVENATKELDNLKGRRSPVN